MYVSPPLAILALLVVGVATVTWLAPEQRAPARVTVSLSTATYEKLVAWAREHSGTAGSELTVEQAIEELANR